MKISWKKLKLVFAFAALLLLIYYYFFDAHGMLTLRQMRQREAKLLIERDSLKTEYAELSDRIEFLQNNKTETVTEEARRWDLAYPEEDEIIIQIDSTDYTP